ncbi:MAG TPA: single-stranded DNA-binding protein [Chitinophagaceae bacterium]|nr:single-stranded DNA-binding protein [Chitinophagaceae bacterium]
MSGINKVILLGRVGKEPEIRALNNGKSVANFSIATSEKWKNKNTGEAQESTEWHNIVFFGPVVEVVENYVHKGDLVYVEGKIKTEKYMDKTGNEKFSVKITGEKLQLLGEKKKDAAPTLKREETKDYGQQQQFELDDEIPF